MKLSFSYFVVSAMLSTANKLAMASESVSFSAPTAASSGKRNPVTAELVVSDKDRKLRKKVTSSSRSSKSSKSPSAEPSYMPSVSTSPSATPSVSAEPSTTPSAEPSLQPSAVPSSLPSLLPSSSPSLEPSTAPSSMPSLLPSPSPSHKPSALPSLMPSTSSAPSACSEKICTTSCEGKEISVLEDADLFPQGIFFDIIALHDVEITNFSVYSESSGPSDVTVYTRSGSYESYERTTSGWTEVFSGTVTLGGATLADLGGFSVGIGCGETQGFLIYSEDIYLAYTPGGTEGDTLVSDDYLELRVGAGIVGTPFRVSGEGSTVFFPRKLDGKVTYDLI